MAWRTGSTGGAASRGVKGPPQQQRTGPSVLQSAGHLLTLPISAEGRRLPRILYLVTEDWYVCSHRLPLIRAAKSAGFDAVVATRVRDHAGPIREAGADVHALAWRRGSLSPFAFLADIGIVRELYRRYRPDIVHLVAIKPAVIGGLAALAERVPAVVTTLAGRGALLSGSGVVPAAAGTVVRGILGRLNRGGHAAVIVQNQDDREWLLNPPFTGRVELIRGSGVDLGRFQPMPEPPGCFMVAQVSRMLTIKGVATVVDAVSRLRAGGHAIRLLLAGDSDRESRAAIPEEQLRSWGQLPGISWLGRVEDVRAVWSQAHCAVLGSVGGEGVPMSLLEAAACGRPIVATDVPGNREVARDGVNALLVPSGDGDAMAAALLRLMGDDDLRRRFGAASRAVVDPEFGDAFVTRQTIALYHELLQQSGMLAGQRA